MSPETANEGAGIICPFFVFVRRLSTLKQVVFPRTMELLASFLGNTGAAASILGLCRVPKHVDSINNSKLQKVLMQREQELVLRREDELRRTWDEREEEVQVAWETRESKVQRELEALKRRRISRMGKARHRIFSDLLDLLAHEILLR